MSASHEQSSHGMGLRSRINGLGGIVREIENLGRLRRRPRCLGISSSMLATRCPSPAPEKNAQSRHPGGGPGVSTPPPVVSGPSRAHRFHFWHRATRAVPEGRAVGRGPYFSGELGPGCGLDLGGRVGE